MDYDGGRRTGRGGNNFAKVENMDLKNGEGESKVDGMECQKLQAEINKLKAETIEIEKRNRFWNVFFRYILPIFVSAILIMAWFISFLRPILEEKDKYREYLLKNLEFTLGNKADSLERVSKELKREKLKLSLQINDLSKALDSLQMKYTFAMRKVSKNGKVNIKLMDSLLANIILRLAKEKDKIDSTKYRNEHKSEVKEFVFPDGITEFPDGITEFPDGITEFR